MGRLGVGAIVVGATTGVVVVAVVVSVVAGVTATGGGGGVTRLHALSAIHASVEAKVTSRESLRGDTGREPTAEPGPTREG